MSLKNVMLVAALALWPAAGSAAENQLPDWNDADFEAQLLLSVGGPVGLYGDFGNGHVTSAVESNRLAVRLRAPRWTMVGLELSGTLFHGLGASLTLDLFRCRYVRVHLDPGIFWNLGEPLVVARVPRDFDLTAGLGVDVRLNAEIVIGVEWRVFVPDPFSIVNRYGAFSRPIYEEAVKGGQLWLTLGRTW